MTILCFNIRKLVCCLHIAANQWFSQPAEKLFGGRKFEKGQCGFHSTLFLSFFFRLFGRKSLRLSSKDTVKYRKLPYRMSVGDRMQERSLNFFTILSIVFRMHLFKKNNMKRKGTSISKLRLYIRLL